MVIEGWHCRWDFRLSPFQYRSVPVAAVVGVMEVVYFATSTDARRIDYVVKSVEGIIGSLGLAMLALTFCCPERNGVCPTVSFPHR